MKFYNEIEYYNSIYNDREKYNLSWAYSDAQDKIDETFDKVCSNEKTSCCQTLKDAINKNGNITNNQFKVVKFAKRSKMLSNVFANMQQFLSIVEIILSVLLVMVISDISHHSESLIESEILSVAVIFVFAIFKVFVERMLLQPLFENWGWKAYHASYTKLFTILEETRDAVKNINDNQGESISLIEAQPIVLQ